MTDSARPEDELDFDGDDEFILEDADFEQALSGPDDSGDESAAGDSADAQEVEEDDFFAAGSSDADPLSQTAEPEDPDVDDAELDDRFGSLEEVEDIIDFADDPEWDEGVGGRDDTLLESHEVDELDPDGLAGVEQDNLFVAHGSTTHGFGSEGGDFNEESEKGWDGNALSAEDLHDPHTGEVDASQDGQDWLDRDHLRTTSHDELVIDDADELFGEPAASPDDGMVEADADGEFLLEGDGLEAEQPADGEDFVGDEAFDPAAAFDGDETEEGEAFEPAEAGAWDGQDEADGDWQMDGAEGAPGVFHDAPADTPADEPAFAGDSLTADEGVDADMEAVSQAPTLEQIQAAMRPTGEGWESVELGGGAAGDSPDLSQGEYTLDDRAADVDTGGYDEVDDGIYSEEAVAEAEAEVAEEEAWEEPDYAEHEDAYYDEEGEAKGTLITRPFRRRVVRQLAAGMAALLLVAASAGVIVWRPAWFGLDSKPASIDVVQVDRPTVGGGVDEPEGPNVPEPGVSPPIDPTPEDPGTEVVVPTPTDPEPGSTDPETTEPGVEQPQVAGLDEPTVPVVSEPEVPTVPPATTDPLAVAQSGNQPTGEPVELVHNDAEGFPVVAPPSQQPKQSGQPQHAPTQMGDGLLVVGPSETPPGHDGIAELGLMTGSRAFAQMRNGNFFVGAIKRVFPAEVTLSIQGGEVTIARADLKVLAPLTAREFQAIQKAESGYVRLQNDNRIQGSIVDTILEEYVIVQQKASHVILPISDVKAQEAGAQDGGVTFADDDAGDAWLRGVVAEQLKAKQKAAEEEKATGLPSSTPPGAPGGR